MENVTYFFSECLHASIEVGKFEHLRCSLTTETVRSMQGSCDLVLNLAIDALISQMPDWDLISKATVRNIPSLLFESCIS